MLQLPSVAQAEISSSPSSMFSARRPFLRMLRMMSRFRRLTVPFLVERNRYCTPSVSCSMHTTRSPGTVGRMLTMFVPLAARPASGI